MNIYEEQHLEQKLDEITDQPPTLGDHTRKRKTGVKRVSILRGYTNTPDGRIYHLGTETTSSDKLIGPKVHQSQRM